MSRHHYVFMLLGIIGCGWGRTPLRAPADQARGSHLDGDLRLGTSDGDETQTATSLPDGRVAIDVFGRIATDDGVESEGQVRFALVRGMETIDTHAPQFWMDACNHDGSCGNGPSGHGTYETLMPSPALTPRGLARVAVRLTAPGSGRYAIEVFAGSRLLGKLPIAIGRVPCGGGPKVRVYRDHGVRLELGDHTTLPTFRIDRWEATDDTPAYRVEWIHDGVVTSVEERHVGLEQDHPGPPSSELYEADRACMWTFGEEQYSVPQQLSAGHWEVRVFREGHAGLSSSFDVIGGAVGGLSPLVAEAWPLDLAARLAVIPRDPGVELRTSRFVPFSAAEFRAATRSVRVGQLRALLNDWDPNHISTIGRVKLTCRGAQQEAHVTQVGVPRGQTPLLPSKGVDLIVTDATCTPEDMALFQAANAQDTINLRESRKRLILELADLVAKQGYAWKPEERPSPNDNLQ